MTKKGVGAVASKSVPKLKELVPPPPGPEVCNFQKGGVLCDQTMCVIACL